MHIIHISFFLLLTLFIVYSQSADCDTDQNCTSTLLNFNASNQSVKCLANRCTCEDATCFIFNSNTSNSTDSCVLNTQCYQYSFSLGHCESTARNRLTALLLQIFIGVLGAANFYIGRIDLGIGQLFLFMVLLIFPLIGEILHCGLESSLKSNSDSEGKKLSWVMAIIVVLCISLFVFSIVSSWWIADVVIFAINTRTDLNGCILS
ncbi:TM2 domain-containing protein 3-like [Oopsacas minuta]|uniref:TM2 domain-containing protein 3-like n=1 Tax=Oopsacas minuta TaxID=111878 RepID=A0AAV7KN70_9METZ|nr:TM2 domain-containing protein 3-like [Oopsacas minuta]